MGKAPFISKEDYPICI